MVIPDKLYEQIKASIPIVCVDLVILHNHHILLLKRNAEPLKDKWFLPGGRLYKNEIPRDCAIRKAKEECGLEPFVGPLVHYGSIVYPQVHNICFCFMMFSMQHKVKLDETSSEYTWIFYQDIEPYIANDYMRYCLRGANLL